MLVQCWCNAGAKLQCWFNNGTLVVHYWFNADGTMMIMLVHYWYITGSLLVQCWFNGDEDDVSEAASDILEREAKQRGDGDEGSGGSSHHTAGSVLCLLVGAVGSFVADCIEALMRYHIQSNSMPHHEVQRNEISQRFVFNHFTIFSCRSDLSTIF